MLKSGQLLGRSVGVGVEEAAGVLQQFARHAADDSAAHAVFLRGPYAFADKVRDAGEGLIGLGTEDLPAGSFPGPEAGCLLRAPARAEEHGVPAGEGERAHAEADGSDVGVVAERAHEARGAENGNAAPDSERRIERGLREVFPVLDADPRGEADRFLPEVQALKIAGNHAPHGDVEGPVPGITVEPPARAEAYAAEGLQKERAPSDGERVAARVRLFPGGDELRAEDGAVCAVGIVTPVLADEEHAGFPRIRRQEGKKALVSVAEEHGRKSGGKPFFPHEPGRVDERGDAGARAVSPAQVRRAGQGCSVPWLPSVRGRAEWQVRRGAHAFSPPAEAHSMMACRQATARGEPPRRPRRTIWGTGQRERSSLDSVTLTKPTGMPMTSAGRTPSSSA